MLYLLGTGIYDTFETSSSIEILKNCHKVYVEKFTSPLSGNFIKILKTALRERFWTNHKRAVA